MEESTCHEMVIDLLKRFSCKKCLFLHVFISYAPAMTMAGALSVTPVRPTYVRTYLRTYVCPYDVRSQSQILLIRI